MTYTIKLLAEPAFETGQEGILQSGQFDSRDVADCPIKAGLPHIAPLFGIHFGHWFRPDLHGSTEGFCQLTSKLFVDVVMQMDRLRSLREEDKDNLWQTVNAIAANALGVWWHRIPQRVAYCRRSSAYSDKGVWPDWLSARALGKTVTMLAALGYLEELTGQPGQASLFQATASLLSYAEQFDVTANDLTYRLPRERLIWLKDEHKRLVDFETTPEIEAWRDHIWSYNAFIANQRIDLDLTDSEWADLLAVQRSNVGSEGIIRPELFSRSVYRVFNDRTFNHGGRLYGPWWQQIPSRFRKHITINGQPTVELDFSGFAIRSIYHQQGIDYRDDPYELEPVCAYAQEQGLAKNHYRESIKTLAQALLNGKEGKPELVQLEHSFRPKFKRLDLLRMLQQKHQEIEWAFASGEGIRNQRLDSDIALAIIRFLTQSEVPVLSVHDSFVVTENQQFLLERVMMKMYFEKLAFCPIIK